MTYYNSIEPKFAMNKSVLTSREFISSPTFFLDFLFMLFFSFHTSGDVSLACSGACGDG